MINSYYNETNDNHDNNDNNNDQNQWQNDQQLRRLLRILETCHLCTLSLCNWQQPISQLPAGKIKLNINITLMKILDLTNTMIISYKNSSSPSGDDERASGVGNLVVETLQGGGRAERDRHLEDKEIIIRRGIEGQPPGEDREIMMMIRR